MISSGIPILARCVDLLDDRLGWANQIRPVLFVPFHPLLPHVQNLLFLELASNAKSSHGFEVSVEGFRQASVGELLFEDLLRELLVGLDLCEL